MIAVLLLMPDSHLPVTPVYCRQSQPWPTRNPGTLCLTWAPAPATWRCCSPGKAAGFGVSISHVEMLALAEVKLPGAQLACLDLRSEWPKAFQRRYDCIVSAYTFHHFPLEEKVTLVSRLLEKYLHPGGNLVIGDIAFQDAEAEDRLRCQLGEEWEQEYYWLANESLAAFADAGIPATYTQVSSCAGVFHFHG